MGFAQCHSTMPPRLTCGYTRTQSRQACGEVMRETFKVRPHLRRPSCVARLKQNCQIGGHHARKYRDKKRTYSNNMLNFMDKIAPKTN